VLLPAPRERVWRAVGLAENFGSWFGADFGGPFVAGTRVTAAIEPTSVDPDIARQQQPYAGKPFELHVVEVRPMEKSPSAGIRMRSRKVSTTATNP